MGIKKENTAHSEKEFVMQESDFNDITNRIYKLAGIVLQSHKKDMVYGRISRRLRALELKTFAEYLDILDGPKGDAELQNFVNSLTTNLTSFFREGHHFEHFRGEMQEIVSKSASPRVRVWCAAASTGEEPYSIAMSCDKAGLSAAAHDIKILCTDIDTNVLQKCEKGIYGTKHLDKLPGSFEKDYFKALSNEQFQIVSKLKNMLIFKQLNLLGSWPMKGPFDVIFCRNVLIYFDTPTRAKIVSRMKDLLKPGGVLYLGHSESYPLENDTVTSEGHTIFRKVK